MDNTNKGGNIMESLQERIAKRAYELFLARGGQHGYHIQDWAQAEKEIKEEEEQRLAKEKEQAKKVKKEAASVKSEETVDTEAAKPKRTRASAATLPKRRLLKRKRSRGFDYLQSLLRFTDLQTKRLHLCDLEFWRLQIPAPEKIVAGKIAYVFCCTLLNIFRRFKVLC
jgi:hypothetical protein